MLSTIGQRGGGRRGGEIPSPAIIAGARKFAGPPGGKPVKPPIQWVESNLACQRCDSGGISFEPLSIIDCKVIRIIAKEGRLFYTLRNEALKMTFTAEITGKRTANRGETINFQFLTIRHAIDDIWNCEITGEIADPSIQP